MGGADVIPGVSGGTIAFISGIYGELLHSLKSVDIEALNLLRQFRISDLWKHINGNFLVAVLAGIVTSIVSLAKLMTYLLEHHPIQIWSFFFGLILISSPLILRQIKKWKIGVVLSFIIGTGAAYVITILSPTQTPEALWFIFIAGAIAICAMILPGISGAFILLLLGKYEFIIRSLIELNFPVILVFTIGCVVGLLSFSHLLTWILDRYHDLTVALLAGFMVGSLNKVWPWKEVISYRIDSTGEQVPAFDRSILPGDYLEKTGQDPMVFQAIMMIALGVFIIVVIEKIAERIKTKF
jgi:putative membrane protein